MIDGSDRIVTFDTTLRDGSQTEGVNFSCEDKLDILHRLDSFGMDFVEGGWPGSNPRDDMFFDKAETSEGCNLVAFGSTRRHGNDPSDDPGLRNLVGCRADWCCIFGKSWDFQVTDALRIGLDENLAKPFTGSISHNGYTSNKFMLKSTWFQTETGVFR